MSIQHALIPHKHVRFCDSLLAIAGYIRSFLNEPRTIDELFVLVSKDGSKWPSKISFNSVVHAVIVLYAIGQLESFPDGRIKATSL